MTRLGCFTILLVTTTCVFRTIKCLPINNNGDDLERIAYNYNPITIKISNFNYSVPTATIVIINTEYMNKNTIVHEEKYFPNGYRRAGKLYGMHASNYFHYGPGRGGKLGSRRGMHHHLGRVITSDSRPDRDRESAPVGFRPPLPPGIIVTVPCNDDYVLVRGICREPYRI